MLDQCEQDNSAAYFGGCPECSGGKMRPSQDGDWMACDEHQTKWCVGRNLISVPDIHYVNEGAYIRECNADVLKLYREVEPINLRNEPLPHMCTVCGRQVSHCKDCGKPFADDPENCVANGLPQSLQCE